MAPNRLEEEEATRILSQIDIGGKLSGWWDFFNSVFFVTIFGGIAIWAISFFVQHQMAATDKEIERTRTNEIRKYQLLVEFSDGIIRSLQSSIGMRKREIWLINIQKRKDRDTIKYGDGRNFYETRDLMEKLRKEFNILKHPDSLCAKAKVLFSNKNTIKAVNELDKIMDEYMITFDRKLLKEYFNKANSKYQEVIMRMGQELNK